jgi:hypothetical protein
MDGVLSQSLLSGHSSKMPWILYRTGDCFAAIEPEGLFVAIWTSNLDSLLKRIGDSQLLVPVSSGEPSFLRYLDRANRRFVTNAPPVRGETWRPLSGPSARSFCTNDRETRDRVLINAALLLDDIESLLQQCFDQLSVQRCITPQEKDSALNRSITLAAAFGLAAIAWTLWQKRERTHPLLTLERFYDLEGRIRYSDETITIRLPLGRRFFDLQEHGLLADISDIPWFGGRTLRFAGG